MAQKLQTHGSTACGDVEVHSSASANLAGGKNLRRAGAYRNPRFKVNIARQTFPLRLGVVCPCGEKSKHRDFIRMRERRADAYPGAPTREGRGHDLHEEIPHG